MALKFVIKNSTDLETYISKVYIFIATSLPIKILVTHITGIMCFVLAFANICFIIVEFSLGLAQLYLISFYLKLQPEFPFRVCIFQLRFL